MRYRAGKVCSGVNVLRLKSARSDPVLLRARQSVAYAHTAVLGVQGGRHVRGAGRQILSLQTLDIEQDAEAVFPCFSVAWGISDIFTEPM